MPQQRAIATRAAVLMGAASVFEREGYAAATIAQILDEVGITKGTLYFHFTSKERLAAAIIEEQSRWQEVPDANPSSSPVQRLVDVSYRFAASLVSDPLLRASVRLTLERNTFLAVDASPYTDWIDLVTQLLTEALDSGELRPEADPGRIAYVVTSSVTGLQLTSEAIARRKDLAARIHDMWCLLMPSLLTGPALKRTDLRPPADRG
jgi:AcrR family transcriptional regulator